MPQLTVVVPTYKRPDYLRQALASLAAQTDGDFVVHVCDNANDEAAAAVVAELNDERFVYRPRETNLGLMMNAIEGFRKAETELVAKLDDDDLWEPTFVERLVAPLTADPSLVLSFSDLRYVGADGEELSRIQGDADAMKELDHLGEGVFRPLGPLAMRGVIPLNACVFRRTAMDWDNVHADTETSFDLDIVLQLSGGDAAGYRVADKLVRYRLHPEADTAKQLPRQLGGALRALQHAEASDAFYDTEVLHPAQARIAIRLARSALQNDDPATARKASLVGLRHQPGKESLRLAVLSWLPPRLAGALVRARSRQWEKAHPHG